MPVDAAACGHPPPVPPYPRPKPVGCGDAPVIPREATYGVRVWRLDRNHDEGDILGSEPDAAAEHLTPDPMRQDITSPEGLSLGDPELVAGNVAEPSWRRWHGELAEVGGRSPLVHFVDTPRTRIELSTTHPGGLPQFITGKSTLLSSLIRDELALRNARLAAAEIAQKGLELRSARGIDAVHLGIGLASWRNAGEEYLAPVLLRPLAIRRYGRDFELKLRGPAVPQPRARPRAARAVPDHARRRGVRRARDDDGVFKPNPVIDRLRGLTSHLQWFNVPRAWWSRRSPRSGRPWPPTLRKLDHPVLDALAGNTAAQAALEEQGERARPVAAGRAHPVDRHPPARRRRRAGARGRPDRGGQLARREDAARHRRHPDDRERDRRARGQEQARARGQRAPGHPRRHRPSPRRHRTARCSPSRREPAPRPHPVDLAQREGRAASGRRRRRRARAPAQGAARLPRGARPARPRARASRCSTALTELARLALLPRPPSTTARLSRTRVERSPRTATVSRATMVRAAAARRVPLRPGRFALVRRVVRPSDEATHAHELAKRLQRTKLPRLLERGRALIAQTRHAAVRVDRRARRLPAPAHRHPRHPRQVPAGRLRPLARRADRRDLLAPRVARHVGRTVAACEARQGVRAPRRSRQRPERRTSRASSSSGPSGSATSAAGVIPEVPVGIADVQVAYQQVAQDLAALDGPLGCGTPAPAGRTPPYASSAPNLAGLAADSDVLTNLQERTALLPRLRDLGLDPLIADLATRHVPENQVAAELELAWWQSALESLLAADRALLGANTSVLDRLEADFRLVDEAHAAGSAQLLAWQLAENWKIGLVDWPDEADAAQADCCAATVVASERFTTPRRTCPARSPRSGWPRPYEVDRDRPTTCTSTPSSSSTPAPPRSPRTSAPSAGPSRSSRSATRSRRRRRRSSTRIDEPERRAPIRPTEHGVDAPARRFGARPPRRAPADADPTRSYRAGGEDLAELVNRRFYGGRIDSFPWAGSFLGHGSLGLDYVEDGTGHARRRLRRGRERRRRGRPVVELVMEHAAKRPHESLMVITASEKHAVRVQQAVLARVRRRTELSEFVLSDRAEPFRCSPLEQAVAQSRDRVIFSIGYGRTPHGRVLSTSARSANRAASACSRSRMTRARRSMVIVTCFRPEDIDEGRLQHGALALAEILDADRGARRGRDRAERQRPDARDLAARLEARGLRVALGHRGKLGAGRRPRRHGRRRRDRCGVHRSQPARIAAPAPRAAAPTRLALPAGARFELFGNPDAVADAWPRSLGLPDR